MRIQRRLRGWELLAFLGALGFFWWGILWLPMGCDRGGAGDGGEQQSEEAGENTVRLQRKESTLAVEKQPWVLRLFRGSTEQMHLPLAGLQLGVVGSVREDYNYDPWWLYGHGNQGALIPSGLRWLSPDAASLTKQGAESLSYELRYPEELRAELRIAIQADGTFKLTLTPSNPEKRVAYIRLALPAQAKEDYYGLGEYFDSVAQRGKLRAMQIEVELSLESGYNEAHIPVPFFTSTKAWGLFVESFRPATFDMAAREADQVTITYHEEALTFYLLSADHPLDVPGLYTRITGAPAIPAPWAFGVFLWRDENKDQAEVLDDAAQIRKHDLAISALWIDRPYDTAVNNFGFDPARYPDAKGMIKQLNDQGFRVGVWSTPYLEPKATHHQKALDSGYFVKMGFAKLNKWSDPLDLTNPEVKSFWQSEIQKIRDLGIEGFKLDYGEDIQVGLLDARTRYGFHNGEDERTMHHKYATYYHQTYAEKLGADGGFLICRGGTFGGQRYASIIWPGDLNTGIQKHRECDGSKCYVGGIPAALIGGLTLSMSGFPFYGADTGGYRAPRPTKEDFIRWGQMTALSTIMQIGGPDPNVNPWDFTRYGDSQFDQQVLDNYRVYIRLHTRLFPYIYTYAKASARHERGATRPFGAAYPEENHHPDDLFLLGDALLAAPIVDRSTSRSIRFPKGTIWFDWWDQTRYTEGDRKLDAPLDRLLLFQRAGSIVPMLRDDIDTLSPVAVPDTVSFQPQAGLLSVRIAPGGNAQFTLYDQTKIAWSEEKPAKISYEEGSVFREGALIEILRLTSPRRIEMNGTALSSVADQQALRACAGGCFLWDATTRRLWLRVPSGSHTISVDADPRVD